MRWSISQVDMRSRLKANWKQSARMIRKETGMFNRVGVDEE